VLDGVWICIQVCGDGIGVHCLGNYERKDLRTRYVLMMFIFYGIMEERGFAASVLSHPRAMLEPPFFHSTYMGPCLGRRS
jgi:hypothetical protein